MQDQVPCPAVMKMARLHSAMLSLKPPPEAERIGNMPLTVEEARSRACRVDSWHRRDREYAKIFNSKVRHNLISKR